MFEKALADIIQKARDITTETREFEVHDVQVHVESSVSADNLAEWHAVFGEWLPRMEEAGWLDGLKRIEVGEKLMQGHRDGALAQYRSSERTVCLSGEIDVYNEDYIVGDTKEYAFIHEMTHHVHIRDLTDGKMSVESLRVMTNLREFGDSDIFMQEVSEYAGDNALEAVAETCSGLVLGKEYSDKLISHYEKLGGPEPLCNE